MSALEISQNIFNIKKLQLVIVEKYCSHQFFCAHGRPNEICQQADGRTVHE